MTGTTSAVALDADGIRLIERTWADLARPGSFFTGADRIAIAETARAARADRFARLGLSAAVTDATRRVAAEPSSIRPGMIGVWSGTGLDVLAYVELVSVVVRVVAIDSYLAALGLPVEPLPAPVDGPAAPGIADDAKRAAAWVPTVGSPGASNALSALPRDANGVGTVHSALYIGYAQVGELDRDPGREISRPQMELIASRTSWLNECFY